MSISVLLNLYLLNDAKALLVAEGSAELCDIRLALGINHSETDTRWRPIRPLSRTNIIHRPKPQGSAAINPGISLYELFLCNKHP